MKLHWFIAPILLVLFVSLALATVAGQDEGSYLVLLTVPDREYRVGDAVEVNVHVLQDLEYVEVDPEDVEVRIGPDDFVFPGWFEPMGRKMSVEPNGTGKFRGTFVIRESDLGSFDRVYLKCTLGNGTNITAGNGEVDVTVDEPGDFAIHIRYTDYKDLNPEPGQLIPFQVYFVRDEELVDPDEGTIDCRLEVVRKDGSEENGTIKLKRVSQGLFQGDVKVPKDMVEIQQAVLVVEAAHTSEGDTDEASNQIRINDMVMRIFAHWDYQGGEELLCDMYFLERDMAPLGNVKVQWSYSYNDGDYSDERNIITDGDGHCRLEMDLQGLDREGSPWVVIKGTAAAGVEEQEFWTSVKLFGPVDRRWVAFLDNSSGLHAFLEDGPLIEPSTPVDMSFNLYQDGDPLGSMDVRYLVHDGNSVYVMGTGTTDGNGVVTIHMVTPSIWKPSEWKRTIKVNFLVSTDEGPSRTFIHVLVQKREFMYSDLIDDRLNIRVGPTENVSRVRLEVNADFIEPDLDLVWVQLGIGEPRWDVLGAPSLEWTVVNGGSNFGCLFMVPCELEGNVFVGEIVLPWFFPQQANVTVSACVLDYDAFGSDVIRVQYIEDVNLTFSGYEPPGDPGDDSPGFSAFLVLGAVAVIAATRWRMGRQRSTSM